MKKIKRKILNRKIKKKITRKEGRKRKKIGERLLQAKKII